MSIPLLEYEPLSRNHRVEGFEVPGDEQPRIYTTSNLLSPVDMDVLIQAAYRQIYNEQQMLAYHRQRFLESQLRVGQITVKDFIRGLATSDSFRRLVYESNNNYRCVEICIQRILGRSVYNNQEKLAWSIVLATKGLQSFIDALLSSEEYLDNFGDNTVPYQRRRILPQRTQGELPFARMARYGTDYRDKLPKPILMGRKGAARLDYYRWDWQKNPPQLLQKIGQGTIGLGVAILVIMFLSILIGF
ncbi:phycobilisome rod-core linker polypeptide CpcG [Leptolyngbya sp. 'hensonii']|uniref:phycobilisome rod-core linker polypeptide n=1 Tax=Leptolyngbya sp. 'hensonii' TaxID=1922337 RepID=UPI00094F912F|nr:phycobilisome rod-core linker polypeptide [Leptolyngbya sp. 'hensonii']OLP19369.1 phycobilisome rod-core linker polypeptide CpcG [Leptolyngbya sp. 'hensonii']